VDAYDAPPEAYDAVDLPGPGDELGARWKAIVPRLSALGPGAARLAAGTPSYRGDVLVVTVPAGRALAEARRARGQPEVEGVLRTGFPRVRSIEFAPLAGTGSAADHERSLREQLLEDPELARIVTRLGAEIESVTALDSDPETREQGE